MSYKDTKTDEEWLEYSSQTSNGEAIVCENSDEEHLPWWKRILSAIFAVFVFFFKLFWAALMLGVIMLACVALFYWAILMVFIGTFMAVNGMGIGKIISTLFLPMRLAKVAWNHIW